jgi:hypothetical protein
MAHQLPVVSVQRVALSASLGDGSPKTFCCRPTGSSGLNVVVTARREDIDDQRLAQGRCLMLDAPTNDETVSRARIEGGFADRNS